MSASANRYNRIVKGLAGVLALIILLPGCGKDIQNKEAVRQGVVDYFAKRPDLMAMDVRVDAVSFQQNEANALVYVQAKSGPAEGGGMQMRYVLERKDNRWVVKNRGSSASNGNPHGGMGTLPPGASQLPPGHPQVPSQPPGHSK